jgi:hypothetical protein
VALHVLDEALTNFLPFYNQLAADLNEQFGFVPMPRFSFEAWLIGLILAIILGYSLIPIVNRGGRFIRVFCTILGVLMIANALGHLLGSVYFGRILPGMWSSPLLLLTAFYVVIRGIKGDWQQKMRSH